MHTWHRKLGHRDPNAIRKLTRNKLAMGIKLVDCGIKETCESCIRGKIARKPFPPKIKPTSKQVLDLLHTDLCGPMRTQTPGGNKYFLTIIDDYSRYVKIYLLKNKSDTTEAMKEYIEMVKTKFERTPKTIRSDRGREYLKTSLTSIFQGKWNTNSIHRSIYAPTKWSCRKKEQVH